MGYSAWWAAVTRNKNFELATSVAVVKGKEDEVSIRNLCYSRTGLVRGEVVQGERAKQSKQSGSGLASHG